MNSPSASSIRFEFVAMMALIMSIGALATDMVLPALGIIGETFNVANSADEQLLITMTFLGIGVGQLFAGALSDSLGRRPIMYVGFAIFIAASFLSVSTDNFDTLVLSRALQGVGLSVPRTLSTAIIRDCYQGRYMAKIMSFIAMLFILVPAVAPTMGALLLKYFGWHAIFYGQVVIALVAISWFALRQPETLPVERRSKLNCHLFLNSFKAFLSHKDAVIYTLALGFSTGAFLVFLSSSETIFIGQYHKVDQFSYLFGSIALAMGIAMFTNGRLVIKVGMLKLINTASIFFTLIPLLYIVLFSHSGNPNVYLLIAFMMMQIFTIGFIFGNLTSLAMEPLGHIAGMGAALIGFVSTIIGVGYAGFVGSYIKTTALPLFIGFFVSGVCLLVLLRVAKRAVKK